MSRISFDNYGKLARQVTDATLVSGRYTVQAAAEREILLDLVSKLQIHPEDTLLDVGCNVGNLLIPLSFLVKEITGIDHSSCIEKLRARFAGENARLIAGDFLNLAIPSNFDKILCYSVLHYLSDESEVLSFISRVLAHLLPGGRALFGDLPNRSRKLRFLNSPSGKESERQWQERLASSGTQGATVDLPADPNLVLFTDELVLEICKKCRADGFDAFILPQPSSLPFGNTREDILVIRPS